MPFYRYVEFFFHSVINVLPYLLIGIYPVRSRLRFPKWAVILSMLVLCGLDVARCILTMQGVRQDILAGAALIAQAALYLFGVKQRVGKSLFLVFSLANIDSILHIVAKSMEVALFPINAIEYTRWSFLLCLFIAELIILIPVFRYVKKVYAPIMLRDNHETIWRALWLIPFTFEYIWFMHVFIYKNANPNFGILSPLESLNQLAVAFGAVIIYHSIIRFISVQNRNTELQKRAHLHELERVQYSSLKHRVLETKKMKHDLKQHLNIISSYALDGKVNELLAYIKQYDDQIERRLATLYCDNYPVNALLQHFCSTARELTSSCDIRVALPEQPPISNDVLVVIFGNLLQNAVEALENEGASSFFELKSNIDNEHLFIHISNTCTNCSLQYEDGLPRSTKTDAGSHGIGLSSVRDIVREHNGMMRIDCENNTFAVHIMLPFEP